jgi:hypothetical protein
MADNSEEGQGPQRAVAPMMMMMMIKQWQNFRCAYREVRHVGNHTGRPLTSWEAASSSCSAFIMRSGHIWCSCSQTPQFCNNLSPETCNMLNCMFWFWPWFLFPAVLIYLELPTFTSRSISLMAAHDFLYHSRYLWFSPANYYH